jgi:HNH endonuclease
MANENCATCGKLPTVAHKLCRSCYSKAHHAGRLPVRKTIEQRFKEGYQVMQSGCWEWTKGRKSGGYGCLRVGDSTMTAHRYSYELVHGPVKDGLYVLHSCDNPPCVNPAHLRLGSHQENMQDAVERNYNRKGENHYSHKVTEKEVRAIRALAGTMSQVEISKLFGLSKGSVNHIISRKKWKHIP